MTERHHTAVAMVTQPGSVYMDMAADFFGRCYEAAMADPCEEKKKNLPRPTHTHTIHTHVTHAGTAKQENKHLSGLSGAAYHYTEQVHKRQQPAGRNSELHPEVAQITVGDETTDPAA